MSLEIKQWFASKPPFLPPGEAARAGHHNSRLCPWEGMELVCRSDAAARVWLCLGT